VIVAVDNNSADGSDEIIRRMAAANRTEARVVCLNQPMPGAGHAARLGVDRVIATIYQMCLHDQRWERLQAAVIGVSDGDTVYHPDVVAEAVRILADSTVDGVMPFLMYKFTAALRLFPGYVPAFPDDLARCADVSQARRVGVPLADLTAYALLPRWQRVRVGEVMELGVAGGGSVTVPLASIDPHGRRFGVLRDPVGRFGYVLADRAQAPVSGFDAALVFLENGGVTPAGKWRACGPGPGVLEQFGLGVKARAGRRIRRLPPGGRAARAWADGPRGYGHNCRSQTGWAAMCVGLTKPPDR